MTNIQKIQNITEMETACLVAATLTSMCDGNDQKQTNFLLYKPLCSGHRNPDKNLISRLGWLSDVMGIVSFRELPVA
jgi:hypothetical protein